MLSALLEELFQELEEFPKVVWEKENACSFFLFPNLELFLTESDKEIKISAAIASFPSEKKEEVLLKLMEANLLGQGTGGGVISLEEKERYFVFSSKVINPTNYTSFKEALEDFTNYLLYWREWIEGEKTPSLVK